VSTSSRHRRPPTVRFLPIIGAALLGVGVGVGGVTLISHTSPTQQASPQQVAPTPAGPAPSTVPPADTERPFEKIAFAAPVTDAAGISMMVLPPEKIKGGVRFTISLVNTSGIPITVDTGSLGPRAPRFNDAAVPMSMSSVRKTLVPGEGYTYQCVLKLPTVKMGQVEFSVGSMNVAGQAPGD
jgi:hypothetical protein